MTARSERLFVVLAAFTFVAVGSAAAGGWSMMGGNGSPMMGGEAGSGMMHEFGNDRSGRAGQKRSGSAIFARECASCHNILPGSRGADGPNLGNVFGRRAGSLAGYRYSRAMRLSGIVWTMSTLDHFIADPAQFIPGNRMPFSGMRDRQDRQQLLSYLSKANR